MMVPSAIEKLGELAVYSSEPTIRSIVSLKTEGYSESKKMGIEEQDYDDDVCHANELHNL